jgi:hypothetical protein
MLLTAGGRTLYVVQFKDVITPANRRALLSTGAEIDTYLPDYAFLVRMTPSQAAQVAKDPAVLAVGRYQSGWKVGAGAAKSGQVTMQVHTFPGDEAAVGELIRKLGGKVRNTKSGVLTADLDATAAAQLAASESVTYVDDLKPVTLMNDVARGLMTVDSVGGRWAKGLDGTGQVIGMADTGLDTGVLSTLHPDLKGQVLAAIPLGRPTSWSDPNGHGTHVAGSAVGDGHQSGGTYKGVAPGAQLVFQSIMDSNGGLTGLPLDLTTLFGQAAASGATIHSDSWGTPVSAGGYTYDSRTRQVDEFIWNNRNFSILFAAGNDGASGFKTINAPGTAKNAITVGASQSNRQNWGTSNPNQLAISSSRGNTPDGRVKPDIVAPGTNILSTSSSLAPASAYQATFSADYAYMSGTSMATPLTAGAVALARQYYESLSAGVTPTASLLKATLINGARDLGYGWMSRDQGWGRVDVTNSLYPTDGRANWFENEAVSLSTGQYQAYSFTAQSGQILKFTLVWSDYPGALQAGKELVNDLDLEVTDPEGTIYRGNCFASNTASAVCTKFDRINNVENVYFAAPKSGTYNVKVRGYNVPMGPQAYSLVVSGDALTGAPTTSGRAPVPTVTAPATGAVIGGTVTVSASTTDDSAVTAMEFYVDGNLKTVVRTRPFNWSWNTQGIINNTHIITVKAYDNAANVNVSAPVVVTVDNQARSVAIIAPADNSYVHGPTMVTTTVTGIKSPTRVEFLVDGAPIGQTATPPFSLLWDTTGVQDGSRMLTAKVYDISGQVTDVGPVHTTVDNHAPTNVQLTTPAAGITVSQPVAVTATADDTGSGVAKVEFLVDGALKSTDTTAPYTWTWDPSGGLNGSHTLTAKAYDLAGNVAVSNPVKVDVNLPPSVSLTYPLYPNVPLKGTVDVTASAWDWDGMDHVEFYEDGVQKASTTQNPYTWAWDTTAEADGSTHALYAKAYDKTGAWNVTPTLTVKVDNQKPQIIFIGPKNGDSVAQLVPVQATVTDNVSVAKVEFYLDGSPQKLVTSAPYVWNWDSSKVSSGDHVLLIKATDTAGNEEISNTVTVTVDAPPVVTITAPAYGTTVRGITTVTVSAVDTGSITQMQFFVDGVLQPEATAPGSFDWDTAKGKMGSHVLTAKAFDNVGNVGMSSPVVVTVDNTGPTVSLTSLANNAEVKGTVAVRATARDLNDVSRVDFYVDDQLMSTTVTAPYLWQWDTNSVANDRHRVKARAYDSIGNATDSSSVQVTVDNEAPTISINAPLANTTVIGQKLITVTTADNRAVARVEFYVDGVLAGTDTLGPFTYSWNTALSTGGLHVLTARAYDSAGNVKTSDPVTVSVDLPPSVRLIPPPGQAVKGTVSITAVATDTIGVTLVDFYLDGAASPAFSAKAAPYTWTWDTTTTTSGTHNITAVARDAAGNETVSAPLRVMVDNQNPAVMIISPISGALVSGNVSIDLRSTDNRFVSQVEWYVDGHLMYAKSGAPFTWLWRSNTSGAGLHTLTAKAYDAMNNEVTSDPVTVTVAEAPTVKFTALKVGDSVSGTLDVTVTAADALGIARVEFFLDSNLKATSEASPYVWTWDTTAGSSGVHTLMAVAYNTAGISTTTSLAVTVDNQGPVISIGKPRGGDTVAGTVTIEASAVDQRGIAKVDFLVDGVIKGTSTQRPFTYAWNTKTVSDAQHALDVHAYDTLGNVTSAKTVLVTVDNELPVVTLVTPTDGITVNGDVTVRANATDNQAIARVDFLLDGAVLNRAQTAPYVWIWKSANTTDAKHKLQVKAYDQVGNMAASPVISVSVDVPATISLRSFGTGGAVRGVTRITADVNDVRGLDKVEFYLDGLKQKPIILAVPGTRTYTWDWDTTLLPTGTTHTVTAKAYDTIGNVTSTYPVSVVIDNQAPAVSILSPGPNATLTGQVIVSANAIDNRGLSKVEFFVDTAYIGARTTAPFNFTWDTTTAPTGTHDLTMKATDTAGNVTISPVVKVRVDLPPKISFTAPAKGMGVGGPVTVAVTATDDNAVTAVDFLLDGALKKTVSQAPYTWLWDTQGSTPGSHFLLAKAYDAVGNVTNTGDYAVIVDNQGPTAIISNPANGSTIRETVTVDTNVTDLRGIAKVEFFLDGNATPVVTKSVAPFNWVWDTKTAADTTHTLRIQATDGLGNVTLSPVSTVTVDNSYPTVSLNAPPDPLTGTKVISATVSDNLKVGKVEFYLDDTLKATVTQAPYIWSWNTATATRDGLHTIQVRAYDAVGNMSVSLPLDVNVDLPPSVKVIVPKTVRDTVPVTAQASDARGVIKVEFYLDGNGTPAKTVTTSPFTWSWNTTGLNGSHTVTAKAYDINGNVTLSPVATVVVDNQKPVISITNPTANATVGGRQVKVTADATDDQRVTVVEFYLDGKLMASTTVVPYTWNWDSTSSTQGPHVLTAKAYDAMQNMGAATPVSVNVDLPPTVTLTAPAKGTTVVTGSNVAVTATATDLVGVAKVEFYVDGGLPQSTSATAPYTWTWDTTKFSDATHTVTAKAYDTFGNVTTSTGVTLIVDNAKPKVSITLPSGGATINGTTTVTVSAQDNRLVTKVEFFLDGALVSTDTVPAFAWSWNTKTAANGSHTLKVKAYDSVGNSADSDPVIVTVSN